MIEQERRERINTRGIQHIGGHSFNICSIVGYENVGRIVLLVEHTFKCGIILFICVCIFVYVSNFVQINIGELAT
jgi:hypothetical protein